jgi:hypothetical protein
LTSRAFKENQYIQQNLATKGRCGAGNLLDKIDQAIETSLDIAVVMVMVMMMMMSWMLT